MISASRQAQNYPNKPVHILVGYAPGGSADANILPAALTVEKVKDDSAKWGKVVKDAKIKAE